MRIKIKAHVRHSKKGKPYKVKEYFIERSKKVATGKPDTKESTDSLHKPDPGSEFIKSKLSREEILLKEAKLGYYRGQDHYYRSKPKNPKPPVTKAVTKKGVLDRAEDNIARFTEKYSGKKYKRL